MSTSGFSPPPHPTFIEPRQQDQMGQLSNLLYLRLAEKFMGDSGNILDDFFKKKTELDKAKKEKEKVDKYQKSPIEKDRKALGRLNREEGGGSWATDSIFHPETWRRDRVRRAARDRLLKEREEGVSEEKLRNLDYQDEVHADEKVKDSRKLLEKAIDKERRKHDIDHRFPFEDKNGSIKKNLSRKEENVILNNLKKNYPALYRSYARFVEAQTGYENIKKRNKAIAEGKYKLKRNPGEEKKDLLRGVNWGRVFRKEELGKKTPYSAVNPWANLGKVSGKEGNDQELNSFVDALGGG